jgi:triosephosphate isomerase
MRQPVLAANWKMNHGPAAARAFADRFAALCAPRADRTLLFFPPAIDVTSLVGAFGTRADVAVGVQNIWTEDRGPFTGETSAPMARDAGARVVLVGHSERRHVFGETDEETAKKCAAAARNGLTPLLCVGELLAERERGETHDVVLRQLQVGLSELTPDAIATMAVAYEPVWAIGTGRTATPADASAVNTALREQLRRRVGAAAEEIPILYGGSVDADNAPRLLAAAGVGGLLVGGASLDAERWARICNSAGEAQSHT